MFAWSQISVARKGQAAGLSAILLIVGALGACRQGMTVVDTTPRRPDAAGTISGTVRGPERTGAIEGRLVEVVNVATGERQPTTTNSGGEFTLKVTPGRYRVQVNLREGETIIKQPGTINVGSSGVDAHADFIVGSIRASRPRFAVPSTDTGLAPPIA
jgi:hypothetical protein